MCETLSRRAALLVVLTVGMTAGLGPSAVSGAVPTPVPGQGDLDVGHDNGGHCVSRARERIRAVMRGKAPPGFAAQPAASNRGCK